MYDGAHPAIKSSSNYNVPFMSFGWLGVLHSNAVQSLWGTTRHANIPDGRGFLPKGSDKGLKNAFSRNHSIAIGTKIKPHMNPLIVRSILLSTNIWENSHSQYSFEGI